ncbi:SDR family oxidoreductase [Streptomyces mirabilis]|uniref:SDR family NAD(P)-dependent oxidoreductase n=1 Tax=Streptomyces mirabilis TaxID=68239 RepID=UPI003317D3C8
MTQDFLGLDGRVVVVSGAAGGGIGTSVTRMIARAGATVIAVSRSPENLEKHVAPLTAEGLAVVPVAADAATDDGIALVMKEVGRTAGDLHGLVNVAGGAAPSTWMPSTWMPSTRVTRADWRALFTQNLETMFFMSQAVAAELTSQGRPGSIVSISSISGMNSAPLHIGYGTAKAALVAATRTMAVELAGDGIRVNAVAPGVTETPASGTYVDEDAERDRRAIAMGRRGRPEEQAGAILFLLSDLSTYITGQTLLVDGGLNLKWTHLAADNTSLFLKDESFRAAITR